MLFGVEHLGPHQSCKPFYSLLGACPEVAETFRDCGFEDLIHEHQRPIASGLFEGDFEFWSKWYPPCFEIPYEELEFGYYLTNLRHIA
jgi:hypothetical protein